MSGNVWEWVYDWYVNNYYEKSPYSNPTGPESGSPMPDGKPYHVLRSGNWYNGNEYWGHSRVSNRNPGHFRGPQDPDHPYYHIGFRIARNYQQIETSVKNTIKCPDNFALYQNYPNPFNPSTTIKYQLAENNHVKLSIYDLLGNEVRTLINENQSKGIQSVNWNSNDNSGQPVSSGIYFYRIQIDNQMECKKLILMR